MAMDQGTTSSRCILFDKAGNICSLAQKEFAQYYPKPGWVEHDPHEIWSSQMAVAIEAMGRIGADAGDIAAIGITNQRETTIVWDKSCLLYTSSLLRNSVFGNFLWGSCWGFLVLCIGKTSFLQVRR